MGSIFTARGLREPKKIWLAEANPVTAFIEERRRNSENSYVPLNTFYEELQI
jgi:hypothetical protein